MSELEARRTTTGKRALTGEEVGRVLEACSNLPQKALIALAVSTGMRRGDVVAVQRDNVEWIEEGGRRAARVRYWVEKKDHTWESWLWPRFASPVRMQFEASSGERYLFPSSQSTTGHIASRTAYNWFQRACEAAGVETPRPLHALRATCIKLCQARGWSVEETMEQVDAKWETIQKHYATPSDAEMRAAVFGEGGSE